jgi:hypothetical protein
MLRRLNDEVSPEMLIANKNRNTCRSFPAKNIQCLLGQISNAKKPHTFPALSVPEQDYPIPFKLTTEIVLSSRA